MASDDKIIDWRSTGRRKARRALYNAYVDFACVGCGKTSKEPPKDAPAWFESIWPEDKRVLDYSLQANHTTKDLQSNDVQYLEWLCVPCHKAKDSKTDKGITTVEENWFG